MANRKIKDEIDQPERWLISNEDTWIQLDLSKYDWIGDNDDIFEEASSSLGIVSSINIQGVGQTKDRDGLMIGFTLDASPNFISSSMGIMFEVKADKPSGAGTSGIGAFITNLPYASAGVSGNSGYACGMQWNGGRSNLYAEAKRQGQSTSTGGQTGGLGNSSTVYIYYGFDAFIDNALVVCLSSNPGKTSENFYTTTFGDAPSPEKIYAGLYVDQSSTAETQWDNVTIKYKYISTT